MGARTIGLGVVIAVCVGIAAWRVSQWTVPGRGVRQIDVYPHSTLPLPAGTYAHRVAPGDWQPRTLVPGGPPVRELPLRIVVPPDAAGGDTSRDEALYGSPLGAVQAHRIVLLADSPVGDEWKARAAALTRPGQWCLVVAFTSPEPPNDSLTMLLTAAARLAE